MRPKGERQDVASQSLYFCNEQPKKKKNHIQHDGFVDSICARIAKNRTAGTSRCLILYLKRCRLTADTDKLNFIVNQSSIIIGQSQLNLTYIFIRVNSRAMISNRQQFVSATLRTKSESGPIFHLYGFVWPAISHFSQNVFVMAANDEVLMT